MVYSSGKEDTVNVYPTLPWTPAFDYILSFCAVWKENRSHVKSLTIITVAYLEWNFTVDFHTIWRSPAKFHMVLWYLQLIASKHDTSHQHWNKNLIAVHFRISFILTWCNVNVFQELFVEMIAKDALVYAQQGKRKTLQRKDLGKCCQYVWNAVCSQSVGFSPSWTISITNH